MPDFIVIGAMKAGTTSLYRHLSRHDDVFLPAIKEPDFFVAEKAWSRGLDWYSSLFASAPGGATCGEASSSYSKAGEFPGVPERIHDVLPSVRLIYLLRDPVERARSMYAHNVLVGRERRPIERALLGDPMYLDASRYARQLHEYYRVFPREQVLVLLSEDLRRDPAAAVAAVRAHVGLPPAEHPSEGGPEHYVTELRRRDTALSRAVTRSPVVHKLRQRVPDVVLEKGLRLITRPPVAPASSAVLDEELRTALVEQLRPDLEDLCELLGPGFPAWGLLSPRR